MMQIDTNPYLAAVMRAVRSDRPALPTDQPFFTRIERVPAGNYVEVWFRTGGCTWDRAGGCTMCNYGAGSATTAADAVNAVRAALDELTEVPHELMISPSGGMWDPREMPTEGLRPIYELARASGTTRFFVETRAETVTLERMRELQSVLPETPLAVELGLESANDGVLAFCVNKGSGSKTFVKAATALREQGMDVYANVSLGTALLDRSVAVRDAVASVRWSLRNGADTVVLFPLHVKPFTLLDVLQRHGRYQPVSLWDLVEALHELGPQLSAQVEIAWYKSYYDTAAKVTTSPVGCAVCTQRLVTELDRYRATQRFEVIADLDRTRCACAPARVFDSPPEVARVAETVLEHYAALAEVLHLESVWNGFRPRLEAAVTRAFADYPRMLAPDAVHAA
jgi:radical SAM enzyme (TIGR01210 family)